MQTNSFHCQTPGRAPGKQSAPLSPSDLSRENRSAGALESLLRKSLFLTVAAIGAAPLALGRDGEQVEPELDCAATSEPYPLIYGMHTVNASITPSVDLDVFEFAADGGETVLICVDGRSNDFDPWIRLFDPSGTELDSSICSANSISTCSTCLTAVLSVAGTHTVVIGDSGANNSGSYILQIEKIVPSAGVPVLPYNFSDAEVISPTTDVERIGAGKGSWNQIHRLRLWELATTGVSQAYQKARRDPQALQRPQWGQAAWESLGRQNRLHSNPAGSIATGRPSGLPWTLPSRKWPAQANHPQRPSAVLPYERSMPTAQRNREVTLPEPATLATSFHALTPAP